MIDADEKTPTTLPLTELQLLAEDIRELKVMCSRVDDRTIHVLESLRQLRQHVGWRINFAYFLATLALLFAGLGLVK